jgi:hypothetical protein
VARGARRVVFAATSTVFSDVFAMFLQAYQQVLLADYRLFM